MVLLLSVRLPLPLQMPLPLLPLSLLLEGCAEKDLLLNAAQKPEKDHCRPTLLLDLTVENHPHAVISVLRDVPAGTVCVP